MRQHLASVLAVACWAIIEVRLHTLLRRYTDDCSVICSTHEEMDSVLSVRRAILLCQLGALFSARSAEVSSATPQFVCHPPPMRAEEPQSFAEESGKPPDKLKRQLISTCVMVCPRNKPGDFNSTKTINLISCWACGGEYAGETAPPQRSWDKEQF